MQRIVHAGAERDEEKPGHAHEDRRHHGPTLWLVGEPHREHRQHRPPDGESPQHRAGDVVLLHLDEGGGDEKQSGDDSGRQRPGHDPPDMTLASGIGAVIWTDLAGCQRGGGRDGHGTQLLAQLAQREHSHLHLRHVPSTFDSTPRNR